MRNLKDKVMPLRICKAVNAFLNTAGGQIFLGVRDDDQGAEEITGIESHLVEISESDSWKNKGEPKDILLRLISERINHSIPEMHSKYRESVSLDYHDTGFGKEIIVIEVDSADVKDRPILFEKTEHYYHRPGPLNVRIGLGKKPSILNRDSEGLPILEDEIFVLNKLEQQGTTKCHKTIGPFRNEKAALTYLKKLQLIEISVSEPIKDTIKSQTGKMALMTVDGLAGKVSNYKEWNEFWVLVVRGVSKSWQIPDESDFYPNIKKASCVECQKEAKSYKSVINEFSFKWNGRQHKYQINETCKDCTDYN